jgi:SAM-dependent methyltransferase
VPLSPAEWHGRFCRQARWTAELRRYLYPRAGLGTARRVLDVGCGTGVLIAELPQHTAAAIHGLDLNPTYLELASRSAPAAHFTQGDAHRLPYPAAAFDACLCHYLLLWVADPAQVVREMKRVTRPGGAVLALAEPDYGGRIDHPAALAQLGAWQAAALRRQGADPLTGRRLKGIFHAAGMDSIEAGVLGAQWAAPPPAEEQASEWAVIEADLDQLFDPPDPRVLQSLEDLKKQDALAWSNGERILYVPTFYAWGIVPHSSTGTPISISPSTTRTG